jgi:flagellar protein FliS
MEMTPAQAIGQLYQRALRDLREAQEMMPSTGLQVVGPAGEKLRHAIRVIEALDGSLNFERGGPMAQNLHRLYEFMVWRLGETLNQAYDGAQGPREVEEMLTELHEAWETVLETESNQAPNSSRALAAKVE